MSNASVIIMAGAIAALILGGVLEVSFHPDRLVSVPQTIFHAVRQENIYEQGRAYAIRLKRWGERLVIRDERQRLQVALLYVMTDSERLKHLLEKGSQDPRDILPQAELLVSSLQAVRQQAETVSVDALANLKEDSRTAFAQANSVLRTLQDLHEKYVQLTERFTQITQALEQQIGDLGLPSFGQMSGEVAGTHDEQASPSPTQTPSAIPLKF